MNYRLISSRGKKNPYRGLLIALVSILVLVILDGLTFSFLGRLTQSIASPFLRAEATVAHPFTGIFSYFSSKRALEEENTRLKENAELMRLETLNARSLTQENNELKKLLGRNTGLLKDVLAVVLLKPSFTPYDTLIIDIGEDLSIQVEDRVLVEGIPIGRVAEVYPHSSLVKLYSSSGEKFQVLIGDAHVEGLAEGMGSGSFMITLPKDVDAKIGDTISIPSILTNTFASIEAIDSEENESFKRIYFRSPVSLQDMKWVQVEKRNAK